MESLLNKFSRRPFGLSPRAVKSHGKLHPAYLELCNFIERTPELTKKRKTIVRQTQIANLFPKPKSLKKGL